MLPQRNVLREVFAIGVRRGRCPVSATGHDQDLRSTFRQSNADCTSRPFINLVAKWSIFQLLSAFSGKASSADCIDDRLPAFVNISGDIDSRIVRYMLIGQYFKSLNIPKKLDGKQIGLF